MRRMPRRGSRHVANYEAFFRDEGGDVACRPVYAVYFLLDGIAGSHGIAVVGADRCGPLALAAIQSVRADLDAVYHKYVTGRLSPYRDLNLCWLGREGAGQLHALNTDKGDPRVLAEFDRAITAVLPPLRTLFYAARPRHDAEARYDALVSRFAELRVGFISAAV
jgi:hypothetical protein